MSQSENTPHNLDALLPPQMAARAETIGQKKAQLDATTTFVLAVLAGAFIAWGAAFSTVVTTNVGQSMPYGLIKLAGGLVFCLGLILVIVAGAELFTGNNLIVMAWASRKITTRQVLRNWLIVFAGNFVGAASTAVLVYLSGQPDAAGGAVGENMMKIANAKCSIDWPQALAAGVGCNILVCLAVWLCMSARTVTDKVVAIIFPITAFVTMGMEHCVANMYFVPLGLLVKWNLAAANTFSELTVGNFFIRNLIPVTIGNVIGGALLVGMVYWFVYLRKNLGEKHDER